MVHDVLQLQRFYETPLGQLIQAEGSKKLQKIWPSSKGLTVLGLGFAVPFLSNFLEQADRVSAVMPARQGIMAWPAHGPNHVFLADECNLPLRDRSVDRMIVIHAFRTVQQKKECLREIWRVLADDGKAIFIMANQFSLRNQSLKQIFGQENTENPYIFRQELKESFFVPTQTIQWVIPSHPFLSSLKLYQRISSSLSLGSLFPFSDILMVEAIKQIYAAKPIKQKQSNLEG
jgi:SAM-dependent methyltransferase